MRLHSPFPSIGDTLCISSIAEVYYSQNKEPIYLSTPLPHLFENNPKVVILENANDTIELQPCTVYHCNIIRNFFNQLGLEYNVNLTPKIYLSKEEVEFGDQITSKYKGTKIITVCLFSSTDCKDVKYDNILPLLKKLKYDDGCTLLLVGQTKINDYGMVFDEQLTDFSLRQAFSIMNNSNLYLGVDTGLFHASAALDIPQVVFFRNCGCENNQYHNTSYLPSFIKCSNYCSNTPYLTHCEHSLQERCIDNFSWREYYNLICRELEIEK
jgi:hypothetical protein